MNKYIRYYIVEITKGIAIDYAYSYEYARQILRRVSENGRNRNFKIVDIYKKELCY